MTALPALRCAGCDAVVPGDASDVFRCPNADSADGRDHVLVPEPPPANARFSFRGARQPFVRHRELLWSWRLARARGLPDEEWLRLARALDAAVARVDGRGFLVTPFTPRWTLGRALGLGPTALWVKDETGSVAGSHKARHLFGLALALDVRERAGLADPAERGTRELAIASCGNAALAAAVVAGASGRPLRVFIPADASPRVVARLAALGARIEVCTRRSGETGDPCMTAFRAARRQGAIPFCVQGPENGLTIEGGETLAWEMAEALHDAGLGLDRLFVQAGGGALGSACVTGLRLAVERGLLPALPRIHVVQTTGAAPLRRAWGRVAARVTAEAAAVANEGVVLGAASARTDASLAAALASPTLARARREAMREARGQRARHMWPWETTPASIAHGILDDETYDWANLVEGTLESGGWPVTVSESRLAEARSLARSATGIAADATGAAGLAGLVELARAGAIAPEERVAVLFTAAER